MVLYSSTKSGRMKNGHDFFFQTLNQLIMTLNELTCANVDDTLLTRLIPNSHICWNSWLEDVKQHSTGTAHHPFVKRTTQCPGCKYVKTYHAKEKWQILVDEDTDVSLHAYIRKRENKCWIMCSSVWVHQMIAHIMLGVNPVLFVYVCNRRGITVIDDSKPKIEITSQDQFNAAFKKWISTLDSVHGFLHRPVADLWDDHGHPWNLSTLSWSIPVNPSVRWVAPHTHEMSFSSEDMESVVESNGWRGFLSTKQRRFWNEDITLLSLFFNPRWSSFVVNHPSWKWESPPDDMNACLFAIRKKYN
jgi:hypothetical protein